MQIGQMIKLLSPLACERDAGVVLCSLFVALEQGVWFMPSVATWRAGRGFQTSDKHMVSLRAQIVCAQGAPSVCAGFGTALQNSRER